MHESLVRGEAVCSRPSTVLIVDPEPMSTALTSLLLSRLGYQWRAVSTGLAALRILGERPGFEAVIWDSCLEFGYQEPVELLRRVSPRTRLILVRSRAKPDESSGAVAALAGVLDKPFKQSELARLLHTAG